MESYLNQAESSYSNHHLFKWLHICECLDNVPTTSLVASGSCSSHQHLFQGIGTWSSSSNSYEGSQPTASPESRIPFSGSPPDGPQPQNGGPNQAGAPGILLKGAENSLSTASASPSSCHPFLWDWERSHPRNDEEITRFGAPDHHYRPWLRALQQESRSPSPDQGTSRMGPPGKEPVSSLEGIWEEMEPINSSRWSIPPPSGAPFAPPVQLGHFRPRHPADFRAEGWKKDAHQAYLYHISVTLDVTTKEAEALTAPVTRHMEHNRAQWHFIEEEDPLRYSVLLNNFYEEVHGYCLEYLDYYTEWIKPRGWWHKIILEKEQLNYCAHLTGAESPPNEVERLSEATLHSHWAGNEATKWGGTGKSYRKTKATLFETLKIHGLKEEYDYIIGGRGDPHQIDWKWSPWRCVVKEKPPQTREVEMPPWDVHRSPGRSKSRQKRSGGPKTILRGNCLHCHHKTPRPPPSPHPQWPLLLVMMGSLWSRDKSLGTKGPGTLPKILPPKGGLQRPPSHPFPSHWRVNQREWPMYTLFLRRLWDKTDPSLCGSMTDSKSSSPTKQRSIWYTSPMSCVSPSLSFTSLLHDSLQACVLHCCHQLWRLNCHHWRIISTKGSWSHKTSVSAV